MFQPPYTQPDLSSARAADTIAETLLGKSVRITASDDRMFEGRFVCVDSGMNVILQGAYQYTIPQADGTRSKSWAGMVMIPGKHVSSVAVAQVDQTEHYRFPQDQNLYI